MISVVSTDEELESIGSDWAALWKRTPAATPFQSPHWMLPWWGEFGTGQPRVAISNDGALLTGILPLYSLPEERKVLPIGAGTTDYLDVLGNSAGLLNSVLDKVSTEGITSCNLVDIQPSSTLLHALAPGWIAKWQESVSCPVLTLPDIPKLARRKLNMNRNRAVRAGGWRVESGNSESIQQHLDRLVRLHQGRWETRGEPGAMADPRVRAFWRKALPGLFDAGLLRLNSLLVRDEVAAVVAALLAPGRIYFYLGGFDEAHAFVGPGTILIGSMLEEAVAEGRSEAHFLRGRESYKYAWGAKDRWNWSGTLNPE